MKRCFHCDTHWEGFRRRQPRDREVCTGCNRHLRSCVNCQHFDRMLASACKLPHTAYVGPREIMNYCEQFEMRDSVRMANEARVARAKTAWEELFRR